jgi:demethylmenaquinone methyltransferase/2-methoxy-6-polyprenyl-1,4-benzoquinol methylase
VTADKVSFGYREVSSTEKKKLVQDQFSPIARTYDLADTLLSFGLDSRWRKKAIRLLGLEPSALVLDACGGTAGLAKLAAGRVGPSGLVTVYDFNRPMMDAGKKRLRTASTPSARGTSSISFVQGDAEDLSFPAGIFDAVTIGFGLRNLARPDNGLAEFLRVLKPGGKLMILEFSVPVSPLFRRLYHFYSFRWMPFAGRLICGTGHRSLPRGIHPRLSGARRPGRGHQECRFRRRLPPPVQRDRRRLSRRQAGTGGSE